MAGICPMTGPAESVQAALYGTRSWHPLCPTLRVTLLGALCALYSSLAEPADVTMKSM